MDDLIPEDEPFGAPVGDEYEAAPEARPAPPEHVAKLMQFAQTSGDVSHLLTAEQLARLGADVVEDYERDDASRSVWKTKADNALKAAAQTAPQAKTYPWDKASNVKYPILLVASLQFAARAYPAVVKGDEAVHVKVFGSPNLPPPPKDAPPEVMQAYGQAAAQFAASRQAKQRRANRVKDYLNHQLFYGVEDWEGDTDVLLHLLPVVGCAFRKTWWDAPRSKPCSALVSPLRLVVSAQAKSLQTAPRVTEEIPDVYPYQITARVRSGFYRDVDLPATGEDDQAPRMLLEQHRLDDLDGDGFEEPYVVTVDKETRQVLRLESAYSPEQVKMNAETDEVVEIDRFVPYTKYSFLPDPEGGFYDIGFGHLLEPLTAVIDTTINQMLDAGHAQVAGGGFIAAGLRLQGSGQSGALKWRPGEYKTVNASGQDLRNAIYERTFPAPSPILFQLLDLMLGAAKDIASIKDVITGDAPTTAPVGTTQAMIEQGLQVFTAIYKRVYRALREEFRRFYGCVSAYGDPQDYLEVVDDPEADFDRDFNLSDKDICPVSDPSVATKLQAMGKAQLLLGFTGRGLNDPEIYKRAFRAFDIEDPDELIPPAPSGPPPNAVADVEKTESETVLNRAKTLQIIGETAAARVTHDANLGGVSGLGGSPADAMGPVGLPEGLAGPEGGVGPAVMGGGGFGPGAPDGVAYEG